MSYTICDPVQHCQNCETELYVEEVTAHNYRGRCMDCDIDLKVGIQHQTQGGSNMGFKIYKPVTEKQDVFFTLQQNGSQVKLVAVSATGIPLPAGHVLTIMSDGRIQLAGGVSKQIGLQVNASTGKVVTI